MGLLHSQPRAANVIRDTRRPRRRLGREPALARIPPYAPAPAADVPSACAGPWPLAGRRVGYAPRPVGSLRGPIDRAIPAARWSVRLRHALCRAFPIPVRRVPLRIVA